MKKLLALTLSGIMAISMVSCSGGSTEEAASSEPAGSEAAASEGTAEATTAWPSGSVTVNVGAKAGGATDLFTRLVTTPWQTSLGEGVAVVNIDNAAVAYQTTSDAKPDGQTLLAMHTGIACQYVTGGSETNPFEDLEVVAAMQDMGVQALVAKADAPYNNLTELVEYAKANPGTVTAGIQTGGTSHFIFGLIQQQAGVEFKFVESQSETDKLTSIAGGFIDLANCSVANTESYEADGKLKVLGLITPDGENIEGKAANWDSLQNQGFDIGWGTSLYFFAPKGTDDATLEAINASLEPVLADQSYVDGTAKVGGVAEWHNLEESRQMFEDAYNQILEVGKGLGISVVE